MKYLAWLWHNSYGERLNVTVRILIGVLQVALGLATVWLSKTFIDETIRAGSDTDVIKMAALLASAVVVGVVLRQSVYFLNMTSCVRGTNRLRCKVYSSIFNRKLYSKETLHSGDVASRVMKDVDTICDVNFDKLPQMVVTTIQLVGAFLLMRWFDPRLAWILLLLTPVALTLGKLISRRLRAMTAEIRESESRIQMHVQESAEHDAMIRSMGGENFVGRLLNDMQEHLKDRVVARSRFTVVVRLMIGLSFGLGYMLAFVWGGIGLRNGTITFGVMTSFLQLVSQIQHPIFNLLNTAPQLIHATTSIDRLGFAEPELDKKDGTDPLTSAGVRFENVSFSYETAADEAGQKKVIEGLNLDFKPKSKIALMGETGAGKTTLFRIMLGLVKPLSGKVVMYTADASGDALFDVDESTRKNFVFVPQGNTLISGTLRLNMQMAKPDVSDQEIFDALHIACADFVKDLPDGLNTELGERGYGLSEGQAERIAVARGLLQSGSVMLLDEISAALDAETEKEMYRRLFKAFPQKTMIFITHREAVCKLCDEVVHL